MTLPVEIQGSYSDASKLSVDVHRRGRRQSGLVVYAEDLVETRPYFKAYTNSTFGFNMNQAVGYTGTPQLVHDGGDTAAWTGTTISGSAVEFSSTDRAYAGTQSVRFNSESVGTVAQFAKGSPVGAGAYVELTMQVNINRRWEVGDSVAIYAYDTVGDAQVGSQVLLEDYLTIGDNDAWQGVAIPFAALGITGEDFDAFRVEILASSGPSPDFFLDVINMQEGGGSVDFRVYSPRGRRFFIRELVLTMSFADPSTLLNGTMPALDYSKWGGLSLTNGVLFSTVSQGVATFSAPLDSIGELLAVGTRLETAISDGTNTFLQFVTSYAKPRILYGNLSSYLSVAINDDLSSLSTFRVAARGELEIPPELSEKE